MRTTSRACRTALTTALAVGLLAPAAAGQSAWQTQTITRLGISWSVPPAMVFDGQDRAQVVYSGNAGLTHAGAAASGPAPTWNAPRSTGLGGSIYGQTYLAMAGGLLYAVYRPYTSPSYSPLPPIRACVFNGTAWTGYAPLFNNVNVYGLAADGTGTLCWVINTEGYRQDPLFPTAGYYVVSSDSMDVVTAVPLLPGMAGYTYLYSSDAALRHGGAAVLDKYGNLHTVQSCDENGTLLYAKGPPAGPLSVNDNLDMSWRVKFGRPSIAVDAAGIPHIACTQGWPSYGLKHLYWTGSSWAGEWVETGGSVYGLLGTFPQVLVGRSGVLHVVYSDLLNNAIKHAVKVQGAWQVETIGTIAADPRQDVMRGAVVAGMDGLGGIGVVYRDAAGEVKYAYQATPVGVRPGAAGR